jgi:flagellar basal-body rod modification protein FlgD
MTTNPVTSSAKPSSTTAAASHANAIQGLSTNDFLTLMTAQLKNQDPLNPTDSNQFLSQLAQLSTVTGISSMNQSMSSLSSSLLSSQALSSVSLVGHAIQAVGDVASYSSGRALNGAVQVPSGASAVMLTITDAAGVAVRHMPVQNGPGLQSFSWDGTTDAGNSAPSGIYGVTAAAVVGGKNQGAVTLLNGTVSSVTLDASGAGVTVNTPELGAIALSNVKQIG